MLGVEFGGPAFQPQQMPHDSAGSDDHTQALQELLDRMLKAGWVIRYGHSKEGRLGVEWSADGLWMVEVIRRMERALGPLSERDLSLLWTAAHSLAPTADALEDRLRRSKGQ
jgi:hypothetical protein